MLLNKKILHLLQDRSNYYNKYFKDRPRQKDNWNRLVISITILYHKDSLSFSYYNCKMILSPHSTLKQKQGIGLKKPYQLQNLLQIFNYLQWLFSLNTSSLEKKINDCWKRKGFIIVTYTGSEVWAISIVTFQAKL